MIKAVDGADKEADGMHHRWPAYVSAAKNIYQVFRGFIEGLLKEAVANIITSS